MTTNQPPSNARSIAGILVMLFIVGAVVYGCNSDDSPSDNDDGRGDGTMAEIMCEEFVTKRLKSPSSAEFPGADSVAELGSDQYEVTASVDSENGFGAMLRTGYTCTIQYAGGDKWTLVSLNLDE